MVEGTLFFYGQENQKNYLAPKKDFNYSRSSVNNLSYQFNKEIQMIGNSRDDNRELNDVMSSKPPSNKGLVRKYTRESNCEPIMCGDECEEKMDYGKLTQWTTGDGKKFIPAGTTKAMLPAGVYEIHHSGQIGLYFQRIPVRTEGLLRFPQTNSEKVLKEIETFWDREETFVDYGLAYKRGIILWGPPGGGKTCTVNLIMKDVVDRGGVVIKFTNPGLFIEGVRVLREVQPKTHVVVLMEDIDSIIDHYEESPVLNILDGVENIYKMVFLATTNYPELLGPRIINRPSRFDKRFKIPYPNAESRTMYIKHLCREKTPEDLKIDIKKWVKDTDTFSIAHIKELFVAVVILGDEYADALENLKLMKEVVSSNQDVDRRVGFGSVKSAYSD